MTNEEIENLARAGKWRDVLGAVGVRDDLFARRLRLWGMVCTKQFTAEHVGDLQALLTGPIADDVRFSLWRLRSTHGRVLETHVPSLHAELVEAAWREHSLGFLESFLSVPLWGVVQELPTRRTRRLQLGGAPAQVDAARQRIVFRWLVAKVCELEHQPLDEAGQAACASALDDRRSPKLLPGLAEYLSHSSSDLAPWRYLGQLLSRQSPDVAEQCLGALDDLLLREDVLAHVPAEVSSASLPSRLVRVVLRKTPLRAVELALAELQQGRFGLLRRESPIAEFTWHEGSIDDIVATVPDRRFDEAVRALVNKKAQ